MNILNKEELDTLGSFLEHNQEDKIWSFNKDGLATSGELYGVTDIDCGEEIGMYFSDKLNALKYTLMLPMLAEKHGATGGEEEEDSSQTADCSSHVPYLRQWNADTGKEVLTVKSLEPSTEEPENHSPFVLGITSGISNGEAWEKKLTCGLIHTDKWGNLFPFSTGESTKLTDIGEAIILLPKITEEILRLRSLVSTILETTNDENVKLLLAPYDFAELNIVEVKENGV
tara:strand:+ start:4700 stop:5386 length:687 start_codon:yes stop_codon:yes gene_type:complete